MKANTTAVNVWTAIRTHLPRKDSFESITDHGLKLPTGRYIQQRTQVTKTHRRRNGVFKGSKMVTGSTLSRKRTHWPPRTTVDRNTNEATISPWIETLVTFFVRVPLASIGRDKNSSSVLTEAGSALRAMRGDFRGAGPGDAASLVFLGDAGALACLTADVAFAGERERDALRPIA
jgi:hypothetical protein